MEKIKVIFTGGTIGSLATGNDISPDSTTRYLLLNKYAKNNERFVVSSPLNILSENAIVEDVIVMAEEIKKAAEEDVKGIILTHGTDTLAYSAAYLSFLCAGINKPVVMVSSNYIITDSRANGVSNFAAAVDFIDSSEAKNGVFVAYKNPGDDFVSIHLGSRMCEPPAMSDCFYSPVGFRFATVCNGVVKAENTNYSVNKFNLSLQNKITSSGVYIHPYNGLDYRNYINVSASFILHSLYHSGTANTRKQENELSTNLIEFASRLNGKLPLYLVNIEKRDVNYNSTNKMLENKIQFLYNMLPNVALAKLMVAYNLVSECDREKFIFSNVCGEIMEK